MKVFYLFSTSLLLSIVSINAQEGMLHSNSIIIINSTTQHCRFFDKHSNSSSMKSSKDTEQLKVHNSAPKNKSTENIILTQLKNGSLQLSFTNKNLDEGSIQLFDYDQKFLFEITENTQFQEGVNYFTFKPKIPLNPDNSYFINISGLNEMREVEISSP